MSVKHDSHPLLLENLPPDVLIIIFELCDVQTIGRLSKTCKKFKRIIDEEDGIWKQNSVHVLGSNMSEKAMELRCKPILSYRDRCRISSLWYKQLGKPREVSFVKKCMPWVVLQKDYLYLSQCKKIVQYDREDNGDISRTTKNEFILGDDIAKFSVSNKEVVCGGRDGKLYRLNKSTLEIVDSVRGHFDDILAVDAKENIIVSGSRDTYVKVWKSYESKTECKKIIAIKNKVLATSIMPFINSFIIGTPGTRDIHPLQLFDLEKGTAITNFGEYFENGAGILDIFPVSYHTFYSCGYDSTLRLWDSRCSENCVLKWEEPFDSTLYCVQSDYNMTAITGTCTNGSFLIWDLRVEKKPVKHHFIPLQSKPKSKMIRANPYSKIYNFYTGPVYSVAFDATHIYAALEDTLLEFSYMRGNLFMLKDAS